MRRHLKRYYGEGDLHFITFSCYRRLPLLAESSARDRFLEILEEVRLRYDFVITGYVVMPEHIHLLMSEPERCNPSLAMHQPHPKGEAKQLLAQRLSVG